MAYGMQYLGSTPSSKMQDWQQKNYIEKYMYIFISIEKDSLLKMFHNPVPKWLIVVSEDVDAQISLVAPSYQWFDERFAIDGQDSLGVANTQKKTPHPWIFMVFIIKTFVWCLGWIRMESNEIHLKNKESPMRLPEDIRFFRQIHIPKIGSVHGGQVST